MFDVYHGKQLPTLQEIANDIDHCFEMITDEIQLLEYRQNKALIDSLMAQILERYESIAETLAHLSAKQHTDVSHLFNRSNHLRLQISQLHEQVQLTHPWISLKPVPISLEQRAKSA